MSVPIKHGTLGGYTNRKCRCDDCKAEHAAYMRVYLPKWRARALKAAEKAARA